MLNYSGPNVHALSERLGAQPKTKEKYVLVSCKNADPPLYAVWLLVKCSPLANRLHAASQLVILLPPTRVDAPHVTSGVCTPNSALPASPGGVGIWRR